MPSGGKRPGAGRPKGSKGKPPPVDTGTRYDDPEAYLLAVTSGTEPPDALRIAAAKALLPYTSPKARAQVVSPPPAKLRAQNELGAEAGAQAEWRAKSEAIRKRHAEKAGR